MGGRVAAHRAAGQGVHPDAYGERFRELCRAACVPAIRLHAVRHTLASALHDAGEPPAAVARFLGHTVATHLQFYVRSTDDSANRAAVRFGAVLAAASSS
jgi:integrase